MQSNLESNGLMDFSVSTQTGLHKGYDTVLPKSSRSDRDMSRCYLLEDANQKFLQILLLPGEDSKVLGPLMEKVVDWTSHTEEGRLALMAGCTAQGQDSEDFQPKVCLLCSYHEEYESDSEDEYVSIPIKEKETPSFANKQVKTPREIVKNQFTHSQKPKVDKKELGYVYLLKSMF
ncbi:hypothetical protein Tco_0649482 [Tanacetum coccineum]